MGVLIHANDAEIVKVLSMRPCITLYPKNYDTGGVIRAVVNNQIRLKLIQQLSFSAYCHGCQQGNGYPNASREY